MTCYFENEIDGCRCNERLNAKTEGSKRHTLGCAGRNNSKPGSGCSGHAGGTRLGQTRKKLKDLGAKK